MALERDTCAGTTVPVHERGMTIPGSWEGTTAPAHRWGVEELNVRSFWHRDTMKLFAPYLGRMRNLQKFSFASMNAQICTSVTENGWYPRIYAAHLQKLDNLWEIYIDDIFFLEGQLHRILRSHTPLEILWLKCSPLTQSVLKHLSKCPSTSQLKHLAPSNVNMRDVCPQPL